MKAEKKNVSAKNEKIVTRYDRKMEARRREEERDKRNAMIAKTVTAVVIVAVIAAAVFLIASSAIRKNKALNETYVKIGNHDVTKLEYDFYFNNYMNQFLNTYSSILPYMGLDTSADLSKQQYTDTMTWKDMFDQNAVSMLISTKSLYDDAVANGFEYNEETDYADYAETIKQSAAGSGITLAQFYRAMYGEYATVENVKPFVIESLVAEKYYDKLLEDNKPSDEEVETFYKNNKSAYDLANFYYFPVSAVRDDTTGDVVVSYEEARATAEAMAKRVRAGEDFEKLCVEYATESAKPSYEPEDSEFSLSQNRTKSSLNDIYADWIYDSKRKAGDVEVFEDEMSETCYVIKFVSVVYDETCPDTISSTLSSRAVEDYAAALTEKYEVTDVKGDLSYLKIPEGTENQETQADGENEAETTTAASE